VTSNGYEVQMLPNDLGAVEGRRRGPQSPSVSPISARWMATRTTSSWSFGALCWMM
jgi:hypothetical protein